MKVLASDCLIEAAQDPKLPYTAYLVEYVAPDEHTKYDIVMGNKQSEIFDTYYDKYGKGLKKITQAGGKINPKIWQDPNEKVDKKKKRK